MDSPPPAGENGRPCVIRILATSGVERGRTVPRRRQRRRLRRRLRRRGDPAHHARLARTASGFELLRLEPAGEILVNGAAIVEPRSLADGDLVTLGEVAFRFAGGVLAQTWEIGDGPLDANGLVVDLDDGRRILDEVGFYLSRPACSRSSVPRARGSRHS